jgi:hypothetical protein
VVVAGEIAHDLILDSSGYSGNPLLRPPGIKVILTEWQVQEYIRCATDPIYFCENYIKIISLDDGIIPFEPYDYQRRIINACTDNRFTIILSARQSGKSVTISSWAIWNVLFKQNYTIAFMANKMEQAQVLLATAKMAYENLPKWMQQGVVTWNKRSVELENGSALFCSATSGNAIRGRSLSCICLDEFAFVPRNIQSKFFASTYPVISSGTTTKIVMLSTPNGMDMFHDTWQGAISKTNDFVPIRVDWWEKPGRDQAWKEETIRNTSEQQFRVEFECVFVGSTNTLLSPESLTRMKAIQPVRFTEDTHVFKELVKDHKYVVIADTARGVSGDYSAAIVIDVTQMPFEVVCHYRDNTVKPESFPNYIDHLAGVYNDASVLVETNDEGGHVASLLAYDLGTPGLLWTGKTKMRFGVVLSAGSSQTPGIRTTSAVKRVGCFNLKSIVESGELIVNSQEIINEAVSFVRRGSSWAAEEGRHDDLMMCLVLFAWMTTQTAFTELSGTDSIAKLRDDGKEESEKNMMVMGIISDGRENDDSRNPFFVDTSAEGIIQHAIETAVIDNGRW